MGREGLARGRMGGESGKAAWIGLDWMEWAQIHVRDIAAVLAHNCLVSVLGLSPFKHSILLDLACVFSGVLKSW